MSTFLKRDAIEENHCLIQSSPFKVRNFFGVLATPLASAKFLFKTVRQRFLYNTLTARACVRMYVLSVIVVLVSGKAHLLLAV